ncbi:GNAT family N-acetyltransferase [Flagellimonas meridianipacifica]|uniref:Acetyltransferase (GNAT) family protein n=1 Tax=Flagellimonas meridianipacifica TaxID=1080225 RepID=A0A2T0MCV4_9FLAO|nr:GNAT family N-acetyltransferase [Allomuricauda pacifica]PRX55303.1 acetyltransferase (GNAT) family protein [Allomuricauda pacifica]
MIGNQYRRAMLTEAKDDSFLEIIRKKQRWDSVVNECDFKDAYHSYSYHQLAKKKNEEPILIHYAEGSKIIALPLLLRKIDGTRYYDATSVYGYPGPITKGIPSGYDCKNFQMQLEKFCMDNDIISIFSRLNPFISRQNDCLNQLGRIEAIGNVIYLNLNTSLEGQRSEYHKRLKTYINKSRRTYSIKKADGDKDLDTFISLYQENMVRVNADKSYFFDRAYFLDLFNCPDFETELLLALKNDTKEVAGGAIFIKKDGIIQYHLSGTSEKYLDLNPIKLLIDEMRIKGTEENFRYFNLGGGVGGRKDSLFYFKSGFSKKQIPFKVWKFKANSEVYHELVRQERRGGQFDKSTNYFPEYRRIENPI